MAIKLRSAPALEGGRWMLSGVQLARRAPLSLLGLMGFMFFGLGLLLALPWIGPLLVGVLMPALSGGWVLAVEALRAGRRPTPTHLMLPLFGRDRARLLLLGGLHAAAAALTLGLAELIDPGLQAAWRSAMGPDVADEARLAAFQALQSGMLLRMALIVPVLLLFWHAPVILLREGGSVARALFASAVASVRNLAAFVIYGAAWVAADLLLSLTLGVLLAALGLAAWAPFFAMPAALFFSAAFYASLHASVYGCLSFEEPPEASDTTADPAA
ncbi:MAG TPA: BPSS1780 family membrane protein [Burkholderiaceae bacterium]|nr:BPSS1780 family membrane protein [Burkholderiaceae bacterium]HNB42702.1 BPSS1780 family membrane protein [Burkholderiaceae bacterium]HNG80671.1 BPSS1780 family membrane protein [Burkholderiaceae bacterium]